MKTWFYICAIILVAGVTMVPAQTTASTPINTNGVAAAPPAAPSAPAPAPTPAPATSPPVKVTAPPRIAPATPAPESSGTPHKTVVTNVPAPMVTEEKKPAEGEEKIVMPTNTVPSEAENTAPPTPAPPAENFGIGHLNTLLLGATILLLGGGVGFFIWNRSGVIPHGSLITSAMDELKKNAKPEDKEEEKPAERKKMEIKFPPPMT